ncbi:unnamed protein product [Rotaria sp. Silwood2]|nr:unnamed protein product [Rotaria sp. Silwood2]CAF4589912.1 unnamed protein product [Rotaria sp. Silwood2]CAF4732966.1 unnamed protein product [Rotaria sp. Silwood2]
MNLVSIKIIRKTGLKIRFDLFFAQTMTRAHLERFLAPLQRLEVVITIYVKRQFANCYRWKTFIAEHLPQLMTFDFKFSFRKINQKVLDRFCSPFWLNKHWFVAFNSNCWSLFTVPYFASTSIHDSFVSASSDCTTLSLEQHVIFYDRVTKLSYGSDRYQLPYRYNHVEEVIFDDLYA